MEETIQYLQIITNVIIILLFIGLVILVFKLINVIKKLTVKIDDISGHVKDLKPKVATVIETVNSLTENINSVVDKVKDNIDVLSTVVDKVKNTTDSIVDKVKDTTNNIIDFEQKVQRRIEPPVLNTLRTISAASIGIKTFFETLKNRRGKTADRFNSSVVDEFKDSFEFENSELEDVNAKLTDLQK